MNLLQIRQLFKKLSGRFDLVNTDDSDNGANFFINEGRKYLDRLDETQKSWGICYRFLDVGFWAVQFPLCRAIKEVWVASTEERWQLEKKSLQDIMTAYLTEPVGLRSAGDPEYYSPCVTRYIPDNAAVTDLEAFVGFVDVLSGNHYGHNCIVVNVPPDVKLMVEVRGLFYSTELVNDTDENYWSAAHPMLLYMSAMRQIEIANRNSQGVKDWETSIGTEMKQLGMDLVEELIADASEMEEKYGS